MPTTSRARLCAAHTQDQLMKKIMDEFVINAASTAIITTQGLEQAISFFSERNCRHLLVLADPLPESLSVRRDMLLASYYAGRAIDMASFANVLFDPQRAAA